MRKRTPKQEKFTVILFETGNATEAYRQSYNVARMKPATINRAATALAANPTITTRLAELQAAAAEQAQITVEQTLAQVAGVAYTNLTDVVTWDGDHFELRPSDELTPAQAAAIKKVKITRTTTRGKDDYEQVRETREVELHDKLKANEMLGRYLDGLFPTRHEHSGPGGGPIPVLVGIANLTEDELRSLASGSPSA